MMYFFLPYRNAFTYLASILVLGFFWLLLEKLDQRGNISSLGPADKKIFWVRLVLFYMGFKGWTLNGVNNQRGPLPMGRAGYLT